MNYFNILALLLIASTCLAAATNFEAEGNLESKNPVACVPAHEVAPSQTPADIVQGVKECIQQESYDSAADLLLLADVYGSFDRSRVSDPTAHQAMVVLRMQAFELLEAEAREVFVEHLQSLVAEGSDKHRAFCADVRAVGAPEYFPRYMIQHGMDAFLSSGGDPLVDGFDGAAEWERLLADYLKCEHEEQVDSGPGNGTQSNP